MAAVILRRVLMQEVTLAPPAVATLKVVLLEVLVSEPDRSTRRKICDVIGELGVVLLGEEPVQWPELVPFLHQVRQRSQAVCAWMGAP